MIRAADDVEVIYARIQQLRVQSVRRGTARDHCSHCPMGIEEVCNKTCRDEGIRVGIPESEFA